MKSLVRFIFFILFIFFGCKNFQTVKETAKGLSALSAGYTIVSGTKLNYVAEGKGIPCLVIGSSVYYPRTFSAEIRNHLRFYFTDMRWFAKEYNPVRPENFTLDTIISDIEKVRSELKLEKFIIAGHSVHSIIAFEYARRYPERVSGVLMIGSPACQTNSEQETAITKLWETASTERKQIQNGNWIKLAAMKGLTPAQFDIENYCLMSPEYWYDMNYDSRWLWQGMTLNSDILHCLYDTVFRDYCIFRNERRVPVPTFVAMGRYDYVDPCTLWEGYNDISGLTIRLFEKSGHYPMMEESELFDSLVLKWMDENAFIPGNN